MYTIVMDNNKNLIASKKEVIYQREKLVDKLLFLVPKKYGDFDLSEFQALLKYIDQGNVEHVESLAQKEELYENYLQYILPIDTKITAFAGSIKLRLTFSKVDSNTHKQYVIHTGNHILTIEEVTTSFNPDTSLEFVDQILGELDFRIDEIKKTAETYNNNKADDLLYEDSKLQLIANGNKIGSPVVISNGESISPDVFAQISQAKSEAIDESKKYINNCLTITEI